MVRPEVTSGSCLPSKATGGAAEVTRSAAAGFCHGAVVPVDQTDPAGFLNLWPVP